LFPSRWLRTRTHTTPHTHAHGYVGCAYTPSPAPQFHAANCPRSQGSHTVTLRILTLVGQFWFPNSPFPRLRLRAIRSVGYLPVRFAPEHYTRFTLARVISAPPRRWVIPIPTVGSPSSCAILHSTVLVRDAPHILRAPRTHAHHTTGTTITVGRAHCLRTHTRTRSVLDTPPPHRAPVIRFPTPARTATHLPTWVHHTITLHYTLHTHTHTRLHTQDSIFLHTHCRSPHYHTHTGHTTHTHFTPPHHVYTPPFPHHSPVPHTGSPHFTPPHAVYCPLHIHTATPVTVPHLHTPHTPATHG